MIMPKPYELYSHFGTKEVYVVVYRVLQEHGLHGYFKRSKL